MSGRIQAARVRLADVDFHPHNVRVDLGDLRTLIDSLAELGLQHPVTLERRGARLRVRDGHRRVAAAKALKWATIPALVHDDALGEADWLVAAVHVNTRRAGLDADDRRRAILALREEGWAWPAIADVFGSSDQHVKRWAQPPAPRDPRPAVSRPPREKTSMTLRRTRLRDFARAWAEHAETHPVTVAQVLEAIADLGAGRPVEDTLPTPPETS